MKIYKRNSAMALVTSVALLLLLVVLLISGSVQGADAHLDWTAGQRHAHDVAQQLRSLGYPEDHPVIQACQDWWRAEDAAPAPAAHLLSKEKRAAYPVAAAVWEQLRGAGLSEVCSAAILGNMMAECGGQTLNLDPYIYSGFYGLCMWSLIYCPEVDGQGVPGQVDYLLKTLESNITAGGGSAEAFLAMTDVRAAAKYFSDFYERPAVWASVRADNAEAALEYFGG